MLFIEKNPLLLQEFGKAVLNHNCVEHFFRTVLKLKVMKLSDKTKQQKCEKELLISDIIGGLLKIRETFDLEIQNEAIKLLNDLNKNRRLLAHGIPGEIIANPKKPIGTGLFTINNRGMEISLDEDAMRKMSNLADNCLKLLLKELIPYVPDEIKKVYEAF